MAIPLRQMQPGALIGVSAWLTVTQSMIDGFGQVTLDPDPMHVNPQWAAGNSPFGGTIAFGFLTVSLLSHLLHSALGSALHSNPDPAGYYLNYGFDRLRLVAPVRSGTRIRGRFELQEQKKDERERLRMTLDCLVQIEGEERPALSAQWLTIWVPRAP